MHPFYFHAKPDRAVSIPKTAIIFMGLFFVRAHLVVVKNKVERYLFTSYINIIFFFFFLNAALN